MIRVATDVGGTFTDFAAYDDSAGRLIISKASSTQEIVDGVIHCFDKSGLSPEVANHFIHGNTVAINTAIERRGARTGLLTTQGFRDVLEIGRGNIHNSFDLLFTTPEPLVPRELRLEVEERVCADGSVMRKLDPEQSRRAIQELRDNGVESIAICLLHSYINPEHELLLQRLVRERNPKIFCTASSDLLRQYREFERSSTTVLNAYVGPRVDRFLDHLQEFLKRRAFKGSAMIMQSNGGTMTLEVAREQPVRTMESGPVGGTIAAAHIGREVGYANVVAFDMGGTTAKVSIVKNGRMEIADGYLVGDHKTGLPVQIPVVDILEVGAGGGSLARFDETGTLKVGPVSAGAVPGPACYGKGGEKPTVTDADVVLGRLNPDYFLGGEIRLDVEKAREALHREVAEVLGLDLVRAAFGIVKVADTNMAHAVRIMTVQKGHDPRDFVLIAYGGAGPSHAISVARELGIKTVVIPPNPGIFSAVGMLLADARDEYVLSFVRPFEEATIVELENKFTELEEQGRATMMRSGFAAKEIVVTRSLEMRYVGQEFTLLIDLPERSLDASIMGDLRARFDELHEARYGHAFRQSPPEIVSLRLHVIGLLPKPDLNILNATSSSEAQQSRGRRLVYFEETGFVDCDVYRRGSIPQDAIIEGPAIIEEVMSTTVVHPGDRCTIDSIGNLIIHTSP